MEFNGQVYAPAVLTREIEIISNIEEAFWTSAPVWTGAGILAPEHNMSLYTLSYSGPTDVLMVLCKKIHSVS